VVLSLLLVTTLSGVAFAKAQKESLYNTLKPSAPWWELGQGATAGFVVLNNPQGEHNIIVNVSVKSGVPGIYDVYLRKLNPQPAPAEWQLLGQVTVMPNGTGSFHFNGNALSGSLLRMVALNPAGTSVTRYASPPITMELK
jgi:hypothetical protein